MDMPLSNYLTQYAKKIQITPEPAAGIRSSPNKLLVEYFGLPSSSSKDSKSLYDDNAPMLAHSFKKFKEWYKQQGGKVYIANQDGLKFFVGKSHSEEQDWSWDPEEQVLYFDRKNAYPYSKFFNKYF